MRTLGMLLLFGGVGGYVYFADQGSEAGRYGCAFAAFVGLLLAMFPKGR